LVEALEDCIEAQSGPGLDGSEQSHFEGDLLGHRIAEPGRGVGQGFEHACVRRGVYPGCLLLEGRGLGLRHFQQIEVPARDLVDQQVAEMAQKVGQQTAQILAGLGQRIEFAQHDIGLSAEHGIGQGQNLGLGCQAKHRKHIRLPDGVAAKTDQLIERRLRIAHPAIGAARDGVEGRTLDLHAFGAGDCLEMTNNQGGGNAAQIESLAS